jgi:uncharacterized membrane protein YozB (DUF420 family)
VAGWASGDIALNAGLIILILKIAVIAVTLLLMGSILAVWRGNYRLHGRINIAVFVLTLTALLGLEVIARLLNPDIFEKYFEERGAMNALYTHLCFSLPAAALLPLMLYTGLSHRRWLHVRLAGLFLALWIGTFVTGVFFLPHE